MILPSEPARADLFYLPANRHGGTTVVLDQKTDELIVHGLKDESKLPKRVFPIGWYANWGGYLAHDFGALQRMADKGFTVGMNQSFLLLS